MNKLEPDLSPEEPFSDYDGKHRDEHHYVIAGRLDTDKVKQALEEICGNYGGLHFVVNHIRDPLKDKLPANLTTDINVSISPAVYADVFQIGIYLGPPSIPQEVALLTGPTVEAQIRIFQSQGKISEVSFDPSDNPGSGIMLSSVGAAIDRIDGFFLGVIQVINRLRSNYDNDDGR